MSGRRAFPRFRTLRAWSGRLRASRQVAVNLTEPGEVLTVISDGPGVVDEELTLALVQGGEQVEVKVRVVATMPQVLRRSAPSPPDPRGDRRTEGLGGDEVVDVMSLPEVLTGRSVIAVLGRDVVVRLIEISRSGCLFESSHAMPTGTIAALSVEIDGREYVDEVRVSRSQLLPGAGERYEVGVEFLWLRAPREQSLRYYAARLTSSSTPPSIGDA